MGLEWLRSRALYSRAEIICNIIYRSQIEFIILNFFIYFPISWISDEDDDANYDDGFFGTQYTGAWDESLRKAIYVLLS